MAEWPKDDSLARESKFFADGRSVRPQVQGTVARGQLDADSYFYSGLVDNRGTGCNAFPCNYVRYSSAGRNASIFIAPLSFPRGKWAGP